MIPTIDQALILWHTYSLPEKKQIHSHLVARVAFWLAAKIELQTHRSLPKDRIYIAGLLHDIDKNIPWLAGESHPDAGVRLLMSLGMEEIAALIKIHPLHAILDPEIAPTTLEEKILFLADKMTKYEIISVDERFRLWKEEELTVKERSVLDAAYPKVKALEAEICSLMQINLKEMLNTCKNDILQEEKEMV